MASTYHCYQHPKVPSLGSCRGCMLPMCGGCTSERGYCSACTKQRAVIEEIAARRAGQVAKAPAASSTTGRLRERLGLSDLPSKRQAGPTKAPAPAVRRRASGPLAPHRFAPERVGYKAPAALAQAKAGQSRGAWRTGLAFALGLALGLILLVLLGQGFLGAKAKPKATGLKGAAFSQVVPMLPTALAAQLP